MELCSYKNTIVTLFIIFKNVIMLDVIKLEIKKQMVCAMIKPIIMMNDEDYESLKQKSDHADYYKGIPIIPKKYIMKGQIIIEDADCNYWELAQKFLNEQLSENFDANFYGFMNDNHGFYTKNDTLIFKHMIQKAINYKINGIIANG